MSTVEVDIKDIERNYASAKGNAKLGGWLSLVLLAAMLVNFFSGDKDSGLFTVGFFSLGGFVFMWGYNKHQADALLKKLDVWAYSKFHKSYHGSYINRHDNK